MSHFLIRNHVSLFDKKSCLTFGFVWELPGYGITAPYAKHAAIREHAVIQRTRCNSKNTLQFREHAAIQRTRCNSENTLQFREHAAIQRTRCNSENTPQFREHAAIQRTRCNSENTLQFREHAAIQRTRCNSENTPQFGEHAALSRQKAKDCGALQHGHQSGALLVGEKQHTHRHVFKCRRGTFVVFFLLYHIYHTDT